ncbi:MAG TPA: lantibiotic dehydratase [Pyrinomonadaceae bacterium]
MVEHTNHLPAAHLLPPPVDVFEDGDRAQPEHLIRLEGGEWALWRCAGLRGAGFPAALPLKLASVACATAADSFIEAEAEAVRARSAAIEAVQGELRNASEETQAQLKKALRKLIKNNQPGPLQTASAASTALDAYRAAHARIETTREQFREAFDAALRQTSASLRGVVADNSFHEALIWQNRQAYHTGMSALLRHVEENKARGSKQRQHEELVASYLQRYCLKNDTIGFFGPVGWAQLTDQEESFAARPGKKLLAARNVYFEGWGIDALAKVLNSNAALKPFFAPRRFPHVHVERSTLFLPFRPPGKLPENHAIVLAACDGERTAKELARQLSREFSHLFRGEQEIYSILETLKGRRLVAWELEVPVGVNCERVLRHHLERIEDQGFRASALELLDEIEAARAGVAAAAGQPAQLDEALGNLETTFERLTDMSSTRNAGEMYAARTLVYEDCRRDIEVKVGADMIQSLGAPISLMLTSARWLTFKYAEFYRKVFHKIYDDLTHRTATPTLEGNSFMAQAQTTLTRERVGFDRALVEEFQKQWSETLSVPEGARRVSYSSEELEPRVRASFAAPRAGWSSARYHSPDVMIEASSVEAIRRGEYRFVLGELHLGVNTLGAAFFHEQHPAPEELIRAVDSDLPEPRLERLRGHSEPKLNSRSLIALIAPKDYHLALSADTFGAPAAQTVTIGSLVVERQDGELMLRTRDGGLKYELVEALGGLLSNLSFNSFRLLEPRAHTPRITIDRLVICRETWRFAPAEMAFAHEKDEGARFIAARRWAREHGMPRFVFTKSPIEVKPFYVDFASPIYVNIFAKVVRRTLELGGDDSLILVSEMLPTADRSWLPDHEGQHYTSELRIVALDLLT